MKANLVILTVSLVFSSLSFSANDCKTQVAAVKTARLALGECTNKWSKDINPAVSSPADNCSSTLSTFINSSKALKACFVAAKK